MLFDIDASQGEWFQFFTSRVDPDAGEIVYDDPVQDAKVQIRSMGPFFEERLVARKKVVEWRVNPKTKANERHSYYPELSYEEIRAEREDAWDYAITGLEGFQDAKTKEVLKCDRETKLKLMKNPVFDRFFAKCLQTLSEAGVSQREEQKKT